MTKKIINLKSFHLSEQEFCGLGKICKCRVLNSKNLSLSLGLVYVTFLKIKKKFIGVTFFNKII